MVRQLYKCITLIAPIPKHVGQSSFVSMSSRHNETHFFNQLHACMNQPLLIPPNVNVTIYGCMCSQLGTAIGLIQFGPHVTMDIIRSLFMLSVGQYKAAVILSHTHTHTHQQCQCINIIPALKYIARRLATGLVPIEFRQVLASQLATSLVLKVVFMHTLYSQGIFRQIQYKGNICTYLIT